MWGDGGMEENTQGKSVNTNLICMEKVTVIGGDSEKPLGQRRRAKSHAAPFPDPTPHRPHISVRRRH